MNKFLYLVKFSLLSKIKSKGFIIGQVILLVLILLISNVSTFIDLFDKEPVSSEVLVFDETTVLNDAFENFEIVLDDYQAQVFSNIKAPILLTEATDLFDKTKVEEYLSEYSGVVFLVENEKGYLSGSLYGEYLNMYETAGIQNSLTAVKNQYIINSLPEGYDEEFVELNKGIDLNLIYLEESNNEAVDMMLSMVSLLISLPLLMAILGISAMVAAEILEEKSSKSIEYIISNVTPIQHLGSKLLSIVLFIVIQSLIICVFSLVGLLISTAIIGVNPIEYLQDFINSNSGAGDEIVGEISGMFSRIPMVIVFSLLFGFVGIMLYTVFCSIASSMCSNAQSYQTMQSPIMFVLMAAFYIGLFGLMNGADSTFLKICAFIPVFTPIIAPMLFAAGSLNLAVTILALIILIGFTGLIFYFGLPIYKVSLLSYSEDKVTIIVKRAFKNARLAKKEEKLLNK